MFSLEEIAARIGGRWLADRVDAVPSGFVVDSRRVVSGSLFFALPGARVDGHAFVADALARGACGAVVSDVSGLPAHAPNVIQVDDPRAALVALARAWRDHVASRRVAVTGSNGKTTTKSLLAHLCGGPPQVYAAPENYNTEIGVPLALLAMPAEASLGVFELGADRPGDIAPLAELVSPALALLTSVGPSHLDGFGTIDAVAREKWSLAEALLPGGLVLVNADSAELRARAQAGVRAEIITAGIANGDVRARILRRAPGLTIALDDPPLVLETQLVGEHNATNVLLAAVAALRLGVPGADIERRAPSFPPVAHRMAPRRARFGVVLDDAYNANPNSVAAAVRALVAWGGAGTRRVLVLGDMLGLGPLSDGLHEETIRDALALPIDVVLPVGDAAVAACRRAGDARVRLVPRAAIAETIVREFAAVDDGVVLVKGSRGVGLEDVVDEILRLAPYVS